MQLIRGLEQIHDQGFLHRDVKPVRAHEYGCIHFQLTPRAARFGDCIVPGAIQLSMLFHGAMDPLKAAHAMHLSNILYRATLSLAGRRTRRGPSLSSTLGLPVSTETTVARTVRCVALRCIFWQC